MSDMIHKCPTCKRDPSERIDWDDPYPCRDPIHDLADLGPAAIDVIQCAREVLAESYCHDGISDNYKRRADHVLAMTGDILIAAGPKKDKTDE